MKHHAKSLRPFIGAKDFVVSRSFYRDFGFQETVIAPNMSLFSSDQICFYLQDAYVKDWIDNSMIFMEVADVDQVWQELVALDLQSLYKGVKLTSIKEYDWGRECFVHDPSGVLWHIGEFAK